MLCADFEENASLEKSHQGEFSRWILNIYTDFYAVLFVQKDVIRSLFVPNGTFSGLGCNIVRCQIDEPLSDVWPWS